MNTALLLIDIQNDYFPNGRLPLERSIETTQKAKEILQFFRSNNQLVIFTQLILTSQMAYYFLPCTEGIKIHEDISPLKSETVIKKHYPNAFKDTSLLTLLNKHKINHLAIVGMATHLAIDATVRAAYDFGFSCSVLHDACTTKSLEFNNTAISSQNVQGAFLSSLQDMYATVMTTREFIQTITSKTVTHA